MLGLSKFIRRRFVLLGLTGFGSPSKRDCLGLPLLFVDPYEAFLQAASESNGRMKRCVMIGMHEVHDEIHIILGGIQHIIQN